MPKRNRDTDGDQQIAAPTTRVVSTSAEAPGVVKKDAEKNTSTNSLAVKIEKVVKEETKKRLSSKAVPAPPPVRRGAPANTIMFHRVAEKPYGCFGNFSGHPFTTTVPTPSCPRPQLVLKGLVEGGSINEMTMQEAEDAGDHKEECPHTPTTITWRTSEHYFQALKFLGSPADVQTIANCATAFGAACAGRSRQRPLRKNWDKAPISGEGEDNERAVGVVEGGAAVAGGSMPASGDPAPTTAVAAAAVQPSLPVKLVVMKDAVRFKFSKEANPDLHRILLGTGDRPIEEYSTKDKYWGNGGDAGGGKNMLGKILMEVRTELRQAKESE